MKPGDLRRWKTPFTMPPFHGAEVFLLLRIGDYSVDFLVNGVFTGGWRLDYILENSEPLDETG